MDVRCPKCNRKLMTLAYRQRVVLVIETVCTRCHKKVDITFPHPLTGSDIVPLVAMA